MIGGRPDTLDSLRVSITDRCNLRCVYCMPSRKAALVPRREILTYGEIERVVRFLAEHGGFRRVRLTGGEPLVRADVCDLVARLGRLGLDDLAMTTNGQGLAPVARELRAAGLGRVNISIDTLREERFARSARRGELGRTIAGIESAVAAGLTPVKLNMVLLRGWNDGEVAAAVRFALRCGAEIRFLELMRIGPAVSFHAARFVPMDEALAKVRRTFDIAELPRAPGATAISFSVSDGKGRRGRVGFVAPVSQPFCGACRRLRLSATGQLRGCLMSRGGVDLRPILRGATGRQPEGRLLEALRRAAAQKARRGAMETRLAMHFLGG